MYSIFKYFLKEADHQIAFNMIILLRAMKSFAEGRPAIKSWKLQKFGSHKPLTTRENSFSVSEDESFWAELNVKCTISCKH